MTKLSALVITYNEVIHIDDLITNLSFADEIIVVDSFSTDGTYDKLKSYNNVKLYQREFINFSDQKNYALSLASHDWVLFTDADERLSSSLISEIIKSINDLNSKIVAYYCKFQYYFAKTPIKYSGFQTAKSYRLFRASKCKYDTSKEVHENLIVQGDSGILRGKINHYSFRDYSHYKEKMRLYAHIKAKQLYKNGKHKTYFNSLIKPIYRFINHYFMRLGILDGKVGFYISKLNAFEVKERYEELDRLNKDLGSKK
jgi:glycosyltransferase involved in cell wall biosynthesis